jgi:hypothetical protein
MLQRARTGFTGAYAHRLTQLNDEYFTVTNLTRARSCNDGFYHLIDLFVIYRQLQLSLWAGSRRHIPRLDTAQCGLFACQSL